MIGGAAKTSAPGAVLLNGALVRILDLNDYVNTKSGQIGGHPSDNIPVALAAAELSGASGRDVLAAIVVGYEIYGRLKNATDDAGDWDGIMVSGFAAPAMAARLHAPRPRARLRTRWRSAARGRRRRWWCATARSRRRNRSPMR